MDKGAMGGSVKAEIITALRSLALEAIFTASFQNLDTRVLGAILSFSLRPLFRGSSAFERSSHHDASGELKTKETLLRKTAQPRRRTHTVHIHVYTQGAAGPWLQPLQRGTLEALQMGRAARERRSARRRNYGRSSVPRPPPDIGPACFLIEPPSRAAIRAEQRSLYPLLFDEDRRPAHPRGPGASAD